MKFIWTLFLILISCFSYAQGNDTLRSNDPPTQSEIQKDNPDYSRSTEFTISIVVGSLALLVIIIEMILIIKQKMPPETAVRFIIVTLIIFATLFLIAAGYNNNQIAPATGLLGTIAGYLLGRNGNNSKQE